MSKLDELDNRVTALELSRLEQEESYASGTGTVGATAPVVNDGLEKRVAELEKMVKAFRR